MSAPSVKTEGRHGGDLRLLVAPCPSGRNTEVRMQQPTSLILEIMELS